MPKGDKIGRWGGCQALQHSSDTNPRKSTKRVRLALMVLHEWTGTSRPFVVLTIGPSGRPTIARAIAQRDDEVAKSSVRT
jgi:hypothetical protein